MCVCVCVGAQDLEDGERELASSEAADAFEETYSVVTLIFCPKFIPGQPLGGDHCPMNCCLLPMYDSPKWPPPFCLSCELSHTVLVIAASLSWPRACFFCRDAPSHAVSRLKHACPFKANTCFLHADELMKVKNARSR